MNEPKHGGKRAGAGRKPTGAAKVLVAMRIDQDSANRIHSAAKRAGKGKTQADIVQALAQKHLPFASHVHPALTRQIDRAIPPE